MGPPPRVRILLSAAIVLLSGTHGWWAPSAAATEGVDPGPAASRPGVRPSGQEGDREETLRMAYVRAESLVRTGSYAEALPLLDRIVSTLQSRAGSDGPGPEARLLLVRSLAYRAEVRLRDGDRGSAEEDLRKMIELAPDEPPPEIVSSELRGLYDDLLDRMVGYLDLSVAPDDATLVLDGEELTTVEGRLNVFPGTHVLVADRPGYRRERMEVEIRAGRREQVLVSLRRLSAVVRLRSRPPGAKVVVDDDVVGTTRPAPGEGPSPQRGGPLATEEAEPSAEMVVEGLMPGEHTVELSRPGYRPYRARFRVPDLSDYDLGTLALERSRGVLVLRNVPRDARITVNGREREPEWVSSTDEGRPGQPRTTRGESARLSLPVGQHRVFVGHRTGMFEDRVELGDGQTRALAVRLRPGVTFLGVLGEEEIGVRSLIDGLADAFRGLSDWVYLERLEAGARILGRTGFVGESPEDIERAGPDLEAVDWKRLRAELEAELPGSLYVGGALVGRAASPHAELWLLPSSPGPVRPERFRVPVDGAGAGDVVRTRFAEPLPRNRPWFGALLIDSVEATVPVVASVVADGPAAEAGLEVGDRIVSIGNRPVGSAARATAELAARPPSSAVVVEVERERGDGEPRVLTVRLGTSPVVLSLTDPRRSYAAAWAVAQSELQDESRELPRWLLELDQALIVLRAGEAAAAARRLAEIRVPGDVPLAAAVAYWRAVALLEAGREAGPDHLDRARRSLERALEIADGRLGHNDGPLAAPRARALLQSLTPPGAASPDRRPKGSGES